MPATDVCPWRVASCGGLLLLGFIFQLLGGAVGGGDVVAFAEIDGLVDGSAFPVGVEVSTLDDRADPWDWLIGWDGDVAGGLQSLGLLVDSEASRLDRPAALPW